MLAKQERYHLSHPRSGYFEDGVWKLFWSPQTFNPLPGLKALLADGLGSVLPDFLPNVPLSSHLGVTADKIETAR
jgi:hypothetical protein